MSAADRMVIRTRDGYRSVPRRVGLGMISRGAAVGSTIEEETPDAVALPLEPTEPHNDEYQSTPDLYPPELFEGTAVFQPDTPDELGPDQIDLTPDEDVPTVEAVELPDAPRGNAARQEWADYASEYLGIEVTDAMSRTKIREAVQEQLQSLARLPQPALTGGRLETPEDEPVTEGSVTDDEDPGTR